MAALWWIGGGVAALLVAAYGGFLIYGQMVETPDYRVIETDGRFELRDYPALMAAEITTRGTRRQGVSAGFSPLARYIFASDRPGEKIAMTAPVTQRQTGDGWQIRFIMPKGYAAEDLPLPANAAVRLVEEPPGRFAAIRFSGVPGDGDFADREAALRRWLADQGLRAEGAPVLAYYNDPFTPGPLRRNEVLLRIAGAESG